jgi:uncharacterized Ntn-hydrolase superfamily protein
MTFSLVARCAETGMLGVAVSSSSPAVAARCAYARAGTGAVASQNITDPTLGVRMLDLMASGNTAPQSLHIMRDTTAHLAYRQILAVDCHGNTAIHSGGNALGIWAEASAPHVAAGGNLLANDGIPAAMVADFQNSTGHLGDRLIAAMRAGLVAGGEAGPVHSAGMYIVDTVSWPIADLRCDWTTNCPISTLEHIWHIYKPQLADYVQRALNPEAAPSYGVPGDE